MCSRTSASRSLCLRRRARSIDDPSPIASERSVIRLRSVASVESVRSDSSLEAAPNTSLSSSISVLAEFAAGFVRRGRPRFVDCRLAPFVAYRMINLDTFVAAVHRPNGLNRVQYFTFRELGQVSRGNAFR